MGNEVAFDDDEPNTTVIEKPKTELEVIKGGLDLLQATIPDGLEIKTEEDRAEAHKARGELKRYENLIKEYAEDNITPLDNQVKRLKKGLKPYKDKVNELVDIIKLANQKYDTAKLKAEEAEKRKAQEKLDKEKEKAMKEMIEAEKEGKSTPPKVLEKIVEVVPPTQTAQRKSDKGTDSVALVKVWFVLLQDGTEWDKKTRLPLDQVKGRSGPSIPYVMVDRVQIQEAFDSGEKLPHWIHVEERANSRFRG